jgi:DNA mismatch repair ATPase MutS
MNPKKMLSKEITSKVKGQISEQTVTEKVDQFFKHGNTFLLIELMNLRREVQSLREELEQQREQKNQNSIRTLIVR